MAHTEADRKAFNDHEMQTIATKMVNEWLRQFPQIGVLNGGIYYYFNDGVYTEVEAFTII